MDILVLILGTFSIVLVMLRLIYGFSSIYPTLVIILCIIVDTIANTQREKKDRKLNDTIQEVEKLKNDIKFKNNKKSKKKNKSK